MGINYLLCSDWIEWSFSWYLHPIKAFWFIRLCTYISNIESILILRDLFSIHMQFFVVFLFPKAYNL